MHQSQKSENKPAFFQRHKKEHIILVLYQNGKTQSQLCKEYGVSQSALGKWIKQYSTVEVGNGELLTAKQVKELQKRNAQLEEENLILKKAIAIFTPHSSKD